MLHGLIDRIRRSVVLSDKTWFELQFDPAVAAKRGIDLPPLPPDSQQLTFTALSGRQNMKQAFWFYKYVLKETKFASLENPKILDFGGGWGRVARLFLRETKGKNIYIAETRADVISLLNSMKVPFSVIHNSPEPPLEGLPKIDLVIAYSVFSHLSEQYFHDWINYFLSVLKPGGHIVFTTRGRTFIDALRRRHADGQATAPELAEHVRRLTEMMPAPDEISQRYERGEFQFYPIGGSAELTPSFFGEAFIPESYFKKHFPREFVSFVEGVRYVDQSIIVLRK